MNRCYFVFTAICATLALAPVAATSQVATSDVKEAVERLQGRGIHVSLFIDPEPAQIETAKEASAHAIEIHTGSYCNASGRERDEELGAIVSAVTLARKLGLEVHGGHGLNYDNVQPVARLPEIRELNIGHAIVARAVFAGLGAAVREMKALVDAAR